MPGPRRKKLTVKRIEVLRTQNQKVWVDSFLDYLGGKGLAQNTIAAYRQDMVRFVAWLDQRSIPEITIRELAEFADWLYRQELAPATLARHIVSVRLFFRYLQLEGIVKDNPAELLGSQKLWTRMPQVLTLSQVDDLLNAPQSGKKNYLRDRALLQMFYATGCRVSEIANLLLKDVHLQENYCLCTGKGNNTRKVFLNSRAIEAFQLWMQDERPLVLARSGKIGDHLFRFHEPVSMEPESSASDTLESQKASDDNSSLAFNPDEVVDLDDLEKIIPPVMTHFQSPKKNKTQKNSDTHHHPAKLETSDNSMVDAGHDASLTFYDTVPWAFLTYRGHQMRREAIWELIKKYALQIGAPEGISPHTMRHSFATHLLAGGAGLRHVQEMLGHKSIATTQIYTHVDISHLKTVHKKFHPRG